MPAVRYFSIGNAQQPLTLNQLIAAPLLIRERFAAFMRNQFVMDQVLRFAGSAPGGSVQYRVSSGLFADNGSEIVNERAEIPLATITKGDLQTAVTRPHGLGLALSQDMIDMDVTGEVDRQMAVIRNTMVRDMDGVFFNVLNGAITQTVTAANAWSSASATIRKNINAAKVQIQLAQVPGATTTNNFLLYQPDTLVVNPNTQADLLNSTEFIQMIFGQINPSYGLASLSDVPGGQVLGLTPLVTVACPVGTAYVIERGTVGGYVDRVPLQISELYPKPEIRSWRSDAFRDSTAFVDQPLAGCKITGV